MSTIFKNTVYRRNGETCSISLQGMGETELSSPPEFGGKADVLSPEEMFVGSINGCLMLTFFYFAKKFDIEVTSYHSDAEGEVEKGNEGFKFTKVRVKAKVIVAKDKHSDKIEGISHLAEKYCLVSNSVNFPVSYKVHIGDY